MAKKKVQKAYIVCPTYKGLLEDMPEDLRLAREARLKNKIN
jgi:hypothetical protein